MINVNMMPGEGVSVRDQIHILEEYPQIAVRNFKPALNRAVKLLEALIRPTIPSPGKYGTGKARSIFKSRSSGTTIHNLKGQVGFGYDGWYMNIVEHGAKAHPLASGSNVRTKGGAARFASGDTATPKVPVFINGVGWKKMDVHKGFGGKYFLKRGYERGQPLVEKELAIANENVARELAA